ncbi:hypothetical protein TSAR_010192 [Trichomalopsis sarcophagae]|uniref:Uncharacterized protein n=1 Tax=Trichomalopsis sarcophagae TaxID=543379 RepID=A0A232EWZ7_9HYME|nr:hypothetical protein TSAR_010192 [Trichomalopsis sarcophagae]
MEPRILGEIPPKREKKRRVNDDNQVRLINPRSSESEDGVDDHRVGVKLNVPPSTAVANTTSSNVITSRVRAALVTATEDATQSISQYSTRVSEGYWLIDSLEDLEKYGRRWEKQQDLDSRYAHPLPAKKMHVLGATYTGGVNKPKVTAVKTVENEKESEETPKKGKKSKAKKATTSASASESKKIASASTNAGSGSKPKTTGKDATSSQDSGNKQKGEGNQPRTGGNPAGGREIVLRTDQLRGPEIKKPAPPEQERMEGKQTRGVTFA